MTKPTLPLIPVLLLLLPFLVISQSDDSERSILLSLKSHWGDLPALSKWNPVTSPCTWDGIQCSPSSSAAAAEGGATRVVTGIVLPNANISTHIPASVCELKNLTTLDLSWNYIQGNFPTVLYNCSALTYLDLAMNLFVGSIPDDMDKLSSSLQLLNLSSNNFSGDIPRSIGGLKELRTLNLTYNLLNGTYPSEIANLSKLEYLIMAFNPFTSMALPPDWGRLKNLKFIYMRQCNLMGEIPESFGGLESLERLDLVENGLEANIPNGLFSLRNLSYLYLYKNNLSGELPTKINSWKSLRTLNLARNEFSGQIPSAIGSLPTLNYLDLSSNDLLGEIPDELGKLSFSFLNLSNNRLSGEIPYSLDNAAYANSFLNTSLCRPDKSQIFTLPRCSAAFSSSSKRLSPMIIVVAVVVFLMTLCFAVFFLKVMRQRRQKKKLASWKLTSFQRLDFTKHTIITRLSEQNVIGSGGSGRVYRVRVGNSGKSVAVKKIDNKQNLVDKQFLAEVKTLGNIKHTNIVKLLCCMIGDESNLLVYEYLENQSLDRWLHRRRRLELKRRGEALYVLDWPRRMRIAIGAAQGLCHMHHDCSPPIVHRDVKSSNILLDSEFNAKIADFGLAKMTREQRELYTMSNFAGSFGYFPPEYQYARKVSNKADVYSFGVVLLELVTGKEPIVDETSNLGQWSLKHHIEGKPIVDALDEEVMQPCYLEEMTNVFMLGLTCIDAEPTSRPSMKEILQALRGCGQLDDAPNMVPS